MKRDREELIDFLLGELSPEWSHEVSQRIAGDPEAASERDLYVEAIGVLRAAAAEGWGARPARGARLRLLRPLVATAAILLVAVGLLFTNGEHRARVFEPALAYGYLLPEETGAAGNVRQPARGDAFLVRAGTVDVGAIGSEQTFTVGPGSVLGPDSEVNAPAESGVRIDMPGGGILFLAPLATCQIRARADGRAALRLTSGAVCTVADGTPIHLAVHDTDLLLTQRSGAAILRSAPADAVCLRGDLGLDQIGGVTFPVPPGRRIPAACAKEPRTVGVTEDELDLGWYRSLVYVACRVEEIVWAEPGVSEPLDAGADTLVYLRIEPDRSGPFTLTYGGAPRRFNLLKGAPLELRLRLSDLGGGPRLEADPAAAITEARLFTATPR